MKLFKAIFGLKEKPIKRRYRLESRKKVYIYNCDGSRLLYTSEPDYGPYCWIINDEFICREIC